MSVQIRQLSQKPGVYLYRDRFGRVIYVGKARNLRKRVAQYFHPSRREFGDRKLRALLESVWYLETHEVKSEPEALLLEGKLIKEYRPRYNVSFRDDKKFLLVKVNLNDPFPKFEMTRVQKEDGARYFGPFAHSTSLRKTLRLVNRTFHLRECSPAVPGENDFKHCLDHTIKNCSAPCVNKISREQYLAKVREACAFLEGQTREMVAGLEKEMRAAAERMDFEKAAKIRNLIEDLKLTTKPVKRFVRNFTGKIDPDRDATELQAALSLPVPLGLIECFDISNISVTHKVASMVCFRNGKPDRYNYRKYRIKTVEGQDDFASMAEVVRRRYARVLNEKGRLPDLIIVDGGKGQLSSALRELRALGLERVPIIGLAKQREEIFRPGSSEPLVLDHNTGALKLLQRIRDEAHRVANEYHQLLLKRRLKESLLDECPGVSERRKKLLLAHFGSVDRLRRASAEKIAALDGIGPKLAKEIVAFFEKLGQNASAVTPNKDGSVSYRLKSRQK